MCERPGRISVACSDKSHVRATGHDYTQDPITSAGVISLSFSPIHLLHSFLGSVLANGGSRAAWRAAEDAQMHELIQFLVVAAGKGEGHADEPGLL